MKKILRKIAFVFIVVFIASAVAGCALLEIGVGLVEIGATVVGTAVEVGGMAIDAAASASDAAKDEFPVRNVKRISKGVYTVEIPSYMVKYKEEVRNKAINLLVQFIGYESYDFKMTKEPNSRKKIYEWEYSVTMPGSIPVVRDDRFSYKIADIALTPVPDTTFGKSKIKAIAYGDGVFVAVGEDKKMAYSQDGITWTAVNNKAITFNFEDITYGNGKFVAVGYYRGGKMAYSSDGVNWIEVKDSLFKKNSIYEIAYGNGMFFVPADKGMAYSQDGVNWTDMKGKNYIGKITYGNGMFVGKTAYSQDGVNWTATKNLFGKDDYIINIVYGDGKFLAVSSRKTAYSQDGINWTVSTNSIFIPGIYNNFRQTAAYGDGKFVLQNGGNMAYSQDGINWITIADNGIRSNVFVQDQKNAIIYGNGKFIIAGGEGEMAYWDGNIE